MNLLFFQLSGLIFSALITYLLVPLTIKLANKYHLVTNKKKRYHPAHTHKGIIPRAGGLPILIAIIIVSLLLLPFNRIIFAILLSSTLMVILGLIDDYHDSSPYLRFIANILIASLAVGFGLGITYVSNPLGGVIRLDQWQLTFNIFGKHQLLIIADFLAILWLVWTTNMVNWSKGVDGQMPGFVAITAFFLGLIAQRFSAYDVSVDIVTTFSFIISGAFLGFIPYNFYPQKIMPGYSGGALAGFILGSLALLSFGKFGTALLILAIPTIDAFYTIIRRIKNKKSPFRADWGHFHHHLLEIGWGRRRIAIFYWLITFILGVSAIFLSGIKKLVAFLSIGIVLLIFLILIERVKKQKRKTGF